MGTPTRRRSAGVTLAAAVALAVSVPAWAQPEGPLVLGGGRLTLGGDVSATFSCAAAAPADGGSCASDAGFFNYTDYERSALRLLRIDVTAALRASRRLSVLGEVRSENAGRVQPYALYLRVRPWPGRQIDLQAGRVPPTFGAFARRPYATDNPLIGYPLAYQYLTSLRPDALPADADELLRMRGRGWRSTFSVGNPAPHTGVPVVSAFRWDTGLQVYAAHRLVNVAAALTAGTLANPLVVDDNAGRQFAGRIALTPTPGVIVGLSAARGPFLTREAAREAGREADSGRFTQTAWGADVEYSRDYYLLRLETIVSDWRLPLVNAPQHDLPLRAVGTSLEGRYKIRPGLYAAGRLDHLGFSRVTGTVAHGTWDAAVTRLEVGGGYALQRNLVLKFSVQRNARGAGRAPRLTIGAAQVVWWF